MWKWWTTIYKLYVFAVYKRMVQGTDSMDVAMCNVIYNYNKINIFMTVDRSCLVTEPLSQPGLEPEKQ